MSLHEAASLSSVMSMARLGGHSGSEPLGDTTASGPTTILKVAFEGMPVVVEEKSQKNQIERLN
jgi:hypothetical protein